MRLQGVLGLHCYRTFDFCLCKGHYEGEEFQQSHPPLLFPSSPVEFQNYRSQALGNNTQG